MPTISWGKRNRYKFGLCGQLASFRAPTAAGVYAVTYRQQPHFRPKAHTVVLFGEAEDISKQVDRISEDASRWWKEYSSDEPELFVFLHPMPDSTQVERDQVRAQLISEYAPHGNARDN